jgi:hypothetical protein
MNATDLIRGLTGMESGRVCRSCGERIAHRDTFEMSESVCRPCRTEADRSVSPLLRRPAAAARPRDVEEDAGHVAVRHILASPSIAARTGRYVRADGFDWPGLLREAETMSTGEGLLVRVAHDLWEANGAAQVWELARRLDRRAFERVVDALAIARAELEPGGAMARAA